MAQTRLLSDLLPATRPLVGVVHLPPLAGARAPPRDRLVAAAAEDARHYVEAGFDAVIVENLGDAPWEKQRSEPHVIAAMTRAVDAVMEAVDVPVGMNVLRNDALGALGICHATGASFLRVNVLIGAAVTDQGIIEGRPQRIAAYRERLGLEHVVLCADLDVKHAAPLVRRPLAELAADAVGRNGADVLLVTGSGTGRPADLGHVAQVRDGAAGRPVWVASGVAERNVDAVFEAADGAIVGTAAKKDGRTEAAVDPARARAIVSAARGRS